MLPAWLTEDAFIWKELIKSLISVIISLLLILLGRKILFRRDRKIRELDRSRDLLDELRKEFVEIDNEYYKVRKRFATVHDAFTGDIRRNPYIVRLPAKREEVMDALLVTCIGLEGRYYTLMQRLKVSFPDFWNRKLKSLMEREDKSNESSLEYYFDKIRDCIEKEKDIDRSIKQPLADTFDQIIEEFDSYEPKLLVYPQRKRRFRLWSTPNKLRLLLDRRLSRKAQSMEVEGGPTKIQRKV